MDAAKSIRKPVFAVTLLVASIVAVEISVHVRFLGQLFDPLAQGRHVALKDLFEVKGLGAASYRDGIRSGRIKGCHPKSVWVLGRAQRGGE